MNTTFEEIQKDGSVIFFIETGPRQEGEAQATPTTPLKKASSTIVLLFI